MIDCVVVSFPFPQLEGTMVKHQSACQTTQRSWISQISCFDLNGPRKPSEDAQNMQVYLLLALAIEHHQSVLSVALHQEHHCISEHGLATLQEKYDEFISRGMSPSKNQPHLHNGEPAM
jgi:hypothetical protein